MNLIVGRVAIYVCLSPHLTRGVFTPRVYSLNFKIVRKICSEGLLSFALLLPNPLERILKGNERMTLVATIELF